MSSILTRSAVLSFSRFTNYLIQLATPIVLVRLLDVEQFGRYREFFLYAILAVGLVEFTVNRSLVYFIPKYPDRERLFLGQSILFVGFSTLLFAAAILFAQDIILAGASFDFALPLVLYVAFFANFDYVELYLVTKRRPQIVLYYGVARLCARLIVVTTAAYVSRDVTTVIYAAVGVEALRCLVVITATLRAKLVSLARLSIDSLASQARFIMPLGLAALVLELSNRASSLFVSIYLGPSALAFYAIAAYPLPLITIIKGGIGDVVFPEMVSRKTESGNAHVELWQRSTVAYCAIIFPLAAILLFYTDVIIEFLFTAEYSPAAPVFRVFVAILALKCLDFDLPLRAVGKTQYFLRGNFYGLLLNLALIFPFYRAFGLLGPALAYLVAEVYIAIYLASRGTKFLEIRAKLILPWSQIGLVLLACAMALPLLMLTNYVDYNQVVEAVFASSAFLACFVVVAYLLRIREVEALAKRLPLDVFRR